jgi:hypothetical protein
LVYTILPELRRPTFGKITMSFIVALFAAYMVNIKCDYNLQIPWTPLDEDYILTWGPVLKPV